MPITAKNVTPLLQVYDMRKSVAFYCDILGFEVLQKHEPEGHLYWAMLKLGDAVIMLNSRYEDDKRPAVQEKVPGHGDVTLYFGCDDADAVYAHLRSKNFSVAEPKTAWYGVRQLTFKDPDGFEICFQHAVK